MVSLCNTLGLEKVQTTRVRPVGSPSLSLAHRVQVLAA